MAKAFAYAPAKGPKHSTMAKYKYTTGPRKRKAKSSEAIVSAAGRSRAARVSMGRPIGSPSTKKYEAVNDFTTALVAGSEVVVRHIELTALAQGTAINQRLRDVIDLSGFELRFSLRNVSNTHALQYNFAVFYPRNQNTPISNGFFRGYGATREVNYPATAADGDAMLLNHTPLNADDMDVLWRHSVVLGPNSDTTPLTNFDRNTDSYLAFKKYIPINRQLRYESTSVGAVEDPLWLSIWTCRPAKTVGEVALTNNFFAGVQAIGYFKEPK